MRKSGEKSIDGIVKKMSSKLKYLAFKIVENMKKILHILSLMLLMPVFCGAQTYTSLWKKVQAAEYRDQPRTQIRLLNEIITKATAEKKYGQLLKAEVDKINVRYEIDSDSIVGDIKKLTSQAQRVEKNNSALHAVYCVVLSNFYRNYYKLGKHRNDSVLKYQRLAVAHPELLAKNSADDYQPLAAKGIDSGIFNNDLLHAVAIDTRNFSVLHKYYSDNNNRPAACISAALLLQNSPNSNEVYSRKSKTLQRIDSLITEYKDLLEAGELAITRYQYIQNLEDVEVEDKIQYIDYALSHWGGWRNMNTLRNYRKELTLPLFQVSIGKDMLRPNTPLTFPVLSLCNIPSLTMKVWRTSLKGDNQLNPTIAKEYTKIKALTEKTPCYTETKRYVGLPDYKVIRDTFTVSGLETGVYLVEYSTEVKGISPERALLYVSDIYLLQQELDRDRRRLVVVNATSGEPIAGANVRVRIQKYDESVDVVEKYTCDNKGEVIIRDNKEGISTYYITTPKDEYCTVFSPSGNIMIGNEDRTNECYSIFTDRSVYRPGQTLNVSVLAYRNIKGENIEVLPKEKITISLWNASGKKIEEKQLVADEYGNASTTFTIPTVTLNGTYTIRANDGYKSVQVSEYKRPTFTLHFDEITQKYVEGDTIKVHGKAMSFAGVALQKAQVRYTIKRRPRFFGWSTMWSAQTSVVAKDTIQTNENGEFTIPVHLLLPLKKSEKESRYYSFDIETQVTSLAGETQEGSFSVPLSEHPTVFYTTVPEKIEKKDSLLLTLNYQNNAGKAIDGVAKVQLGAGKAWQTCAVNKAISFSLSVLSTGRQQLVAICGNDTIRELFLVYDVNATKVPVDTLDWFNQRDFIFDADHQQARIQIGTSAPQQHIVYTIATNDSVMEQGAFDIKNEVFTHVVSYKPEYKKGVLITYAWVKNDVCYTHSASIVRPLPDKKLDVAWKTFRNRLTPGQKEEWTLTVSKDKKKIARAQILASMYDKSLDEIVGHQFYFNPRLGYTLPYMYWVKLYYNSSTLYGEQPFKPLHTPNLDFTTFKVDREVAVSSYSNVKIRGRSKLYYEETKEIVPGATRVMSAKTMAQPEMMAVALEGSVAGSQLYGYRTSGEDNATSDANSNKVGSNKEANAMKNALETRRNFAETAFFYPNIQTNEEGEASFTFTLPESVTTWKFMAFAHDKDMNYGFLTDEAVAQKTVMIQPNMPRFLRIGDKGVLSSQLSNMSLKAIKGVATLEVIDPETQKMLYSQNKKYALGAQATQGLDFNFDTSQWPSLVIIRCVASGKGFSDGEQHYVPILSDSEWVTNSTTFTLTKPQTKTINTASLFASDSQKKQLTIEYTQNPAWLSILSLPSIAEPKDNNAIDIAASLYANITARAILNASPNIKNVLEIWRNNPTKESPLTSALEQNAELKSLVLAETPWVLEADKETMQRQQLINYFDESQIDYRLKQQTDALQRLQTTQGGFAWYPGMMPNGYVTTVVSELLGRLNQRNLIDNDLKIVFDKGLRYIERDLTKRLKELENSVVGKYNTYYLHETIAHYLYVHALGDSQKQSSKVVSDDYLFTKILRQSKELTIYGKAKVAYALYKRRANNAQYLTKAKELLNSIKEYSVYNEEKGRFFNTYKAPYSWLDGRVPTQVATIELLQTMAQEDEQTIAQMQQWLVQTYRSLRKQSALNAVDVAYVLVGNKKDAMQLENLTQAPAIKINNNRVEAAKASAGLGYVKVSQLVNNPPVVTIEKNDNTTSWGAVYAQFEQKITNVSAATSGLSIRRDVFFNGKEANNVSFKKGDKITIKITINADKDYNFVEVSDKRAACLEPTLQLSGYQQGAYCSMKDNVTHYFFDRLSKGTHELTATYYIDKEGAFQSGTCVVQCLYAPEFIARDAAKTFKVVGN
jgi:alpha-2-macroglobulin family N-region